MGLFDKVVDKVISTETIRMPYTQLAEIVKKEFVLGQNDEYLEKVRKTAKGGFVLFEKRLKTQDERYEFYVGLRPTRLVWLPSKPAWVFDKQENKFYQLDKDIKWKKFYKAVADYVNAEKTNRSR